MSSESKKLTIGQILQKRYRIDEEIGEGGFGAVYKAWDLALDGPCAIKQMFETSPSAIKQFKLEASLLFKLIHPNLPRAHNCFEDAMGWFLTMDYIEGEDLDQKLQKNHGSLPASTVLPWFYQVCDALTYLHTRPTPVIHRDIKPANIKITHDGKAFLVDFGIAKIGPTKSAALAVTPGYAPPEQHQMGTTDARSDIYSLGATLYALLTGGEPPNSFDVERGVTAPPTPVHILNPEVPQQVSAAIRRAMELAPLKRWNTVKEFKAATETPREEPPPKHLWPLTAILICSGLVAFLLVCGGAWYIFHHWGPRFTATSLPPTESIGGVLPPIGTGPVQPSHVPPLAPATHPPDIVKEPVISTLKLNPKDGASLVLIPQGEFTMGLTDAQISALLSICSDCKYSTFQPSTPAHKVYLEDYWIYQTEVTNKMYAGCVSDGACSNPKKARSSTRTLYFGNPNYDNYPVVFVDWSDADAYCHWAGGRLPTEAEWEKAGRGTDGRLFPWGNDPPTDQIANVANFYSDTTAVGRFKQGASPYGVYDMAGNVYEWVSDWYAGQYYQESPYHNPTGPAAQAGKNPPRSIKGGNWFWTGAYASPGYHDYWEPDQNSNDVGFRCAMDNNPAPTTISQPDKNPIGKIVFACQVTGNVLQDQICLINADGTGWRQLTDDTKSENNFPSLSPDGNSVVFVTDYLGESDIYELNLTSNRITQLISGLGTLNAPEISPDGRSIVFTNKEGGNSIWVMDRDGSNSHQIYGLPNEGFGWDPVWSPDGRKILFASGTVQKPNLSIMNADGSDAQVVSELDGLSGRSDWSPDGQKIATYIGTTWNREIVIMNVDGSNPQKITNGGNNLAPSFSPDGQWIAFTSYKDNYRNDNGCEIYIMRIDGSDIRRLTKNDYCDYQPRWGP